MTNQPGRYACPKCAYPEKLGTKCGCGLEFIPERRDMPHYITWCETWQDEEALRKRAAKRLTRKIKTEIETGEREQYATWSQWNYTDQAIRDEVEKQWSIVVT